ncbi:MAG: anthranilate phosphoribosyltransferase, partial [Actinobacteria bacterium]|nr:anthranilate phosphoribosyltransferase [Actinomycetota bacterium]
LDLALLNAGAAILVAGGAEDLAAGIERARESVAGGAATTVLEKLVERSRALAGSG